ncbi:MAG: T9SS C-terminal target domain-containing protein [Bacteroidetes bacterium]|nr:MAG: T9SS C-terminal target domain-containing protein [Bacteroidota bacterium]
MNRVLLLLTVLVLSLSFLRAQTVYEDFEGGVADQNWIGADGVYNGVFINPDPTGLNTSGFVGSYTKSTAHAYSLFIATLPAVMDLSVNNQFKIKIYSPVATQVLLKLEGTGGAIEQIKNIVNTNVWQEYTFDFSAAAGNTTLNKIIIFFDPGVTTSGDTYLFDDVIASPAGACAGTVADPEIIDNFECQRNASYGAGWNILSVINNPDPTGINTSAQVGSYLDPLDQYSAIVIDYEAAIDLSVRNNIALKVWAPKAGPLLVKLEGGASASKELFINITQPNQWVEYVADFSDQAAASHKKIVIFFNAGVTALPNETYYIDDIRRIVKPLPPPIEDFEAGPRLSWAPSGNNAALHGTFAGVVANPSTTGVNTSPNVGSYTRGSSLFSSLVGLLPAPLDLSTNTQFNLQVLAPGGTTKVRMQLVSPTVGIREVTADLATPGQWEELVFDFSTHSSVTDFDQVNLLFNPGFAGATTWLFDNLSQVASTVDPCAGVVPIANALDDFECQRNVTYGAGGDILTVVNNPLASQGNGSLKVGKYVDPLDQYSALVLEFGQAIDLSTFNQFSFKMLATRVVPIVVKLEGGTSPAVELPIGSSIANSWETYVADLSPYAGQNHTKVAIFFNFGVTAQAGDIYHIDNLEWRRDAFTGCINNYETPNTSITNFKYFANGALETSPFEVVANPNPSGINTSANVGKFVKAADALPFAGMYADLGAPIRFGTNKTIKAKVHMDHIGNFAIKLEGSATVPPAAAIEIPIPNTLVNQWEELTFDFSAASDASLYQRLTIFFDLPIDATGVDVTSYFDDIIVGDGNCAVTGIDFTPDAALFSIAPNPASDLLTVKNARLADRIVIYNALGQRMLSIEPGQEEELTISIAQLPNGIYQLAGYSRSGQLAAQAKFIKN